MSLRGECLSGEIFYSLNEASVVIDGWRQHYTHQKVPFSARLQVSGSGDPSYPTHPNESAGHHAVDSKHAHNNWTRLSGRAFLIDLLLLQVIAWVYKKILCRPRN